ncbi:MAG: hypothetical protein PVSMB7_22610 [Chloroflexota bacterium]
MDATGTTINRLRVVGKTILRSALIVCAVARVAEAQYEWKPGFQWPGENGLNAQVQSLTVFDDSTGPALYAGGYFTIAGDVVANGIAKWDGTRWSSLDTGITGGTYPTVLALTVFDDGAGPVLYVGGTFTAAGGVAANNIAKWDGTQWSALDSGTDWEVYALTVFDDGTGPALYAGGSFTMAGGEPAKRIAKWDGTTWTALDGGIGGSLVYPVVYALAAFDDGTGPALFAGGRFNRAGDVPVVSIAKWDGAVWSSIGDGIRLDVLALAVFDDGTGAALYAGGGYREAGRLGKWEGGTRWTVTGDFDRLPRGAYVAALTVFDEGTGPALYASGRFDTANGEPANNIAKWDGTTWAPLGSGTNGNSSLRALEVFDDGAGSALFVGGHFTTAGDVPSDEIAKWGSVITGCRAHRRLPKHSEAEASASNQARPLFCAF